MTDPHVLADEGPAVSVCRHGCAPSAGHWRQCPNCGGDTLQVHARDYSGVQNSAHHGTASDGADALTLDDWRD